MPSKDIIVKPITRKTMVLFFLIDTSGSMRGEKIGAVNSGIEDSIMDIREMTNPDAQVKIAVLTFSSGAEWQSPKPIEIEKYSYNRLDAEGLTDLGEACKMLNEKLSRKEFMSDEAGNYEPVIILVSDGNPTDNYDEGLKTLKKNDWFKVAIKIALAVGEDVNRSELEKFTGDIGFVIPIKDKKQLRKIIRFSTVTMTGIVSRSNPITVTSNSSTNKGLTKKQEEALEIMTNIDIDSNDDEEIEEYQG